MEEGKFVLINAEDVVEHFSYENANSEIEQMFRTSEKYLNPVRLMVNSRITHGLLAVMPSFGDREAMFGLKAISVFPGNVEKGLHSHLGSVMLYSGETGALLAMINATEITSRRTAAASAVATKYLAKDNASILTIIGSGPEARSHILALQHVRQFTQCRVVSRKIENAKRLVDDLKSKVPFELLAYDDIEKAVRGADVLCVVTTSSVPVLKREWISLGCHINAVGAHTAKTREIDTDTVKDSHIFVDSLEGAAKEAGDILIPVSEGEITLGHIRGTLSQVVKKEIPGRLSMEDITLFKSLGLAMEDLVSAAFIYHQAKKLKFGTWASL